MSVADPFTCPHCAAPLPRNSSRCEACRLRLVGPQARRLWQVHQHIDALTAESQRLIEELLQPEQPGTRPIVSPAPVSHGAETGAQAVVQRRSMSAQQLLLALGALLLLSAASFFLYVAWDLVGVAGQAVIMVVLTATAVIASVLAVRRHLPAAAETAAVIATGLLGLDLFGAHRLDLAGLGSIPADLYCSGAAVVAGLALLTFDGLVRRPTEGRPLRPIVTYRPVAGIVFAAAPWFLLDALDPDAAGLVAALGVLAVLTAGLALVALRYDRPAVPPGPPGAPQRMWSLLPLSAAPLLVSASVALARHLVNGLELGYDFREAASQRYLGFALLLLVPLGLAVSSTGVGARMRLSVEHRTKLAVVAVCWAVPVLGIPISDSPYQLLVGLSLAVAAVACGAHLGLLSTTVQPQATWWRALAVVAFLAQPVLVSLVWVTTTEHERTFAGLASGTAGQQADAAVILVVLPALAWAAASVLGTVRRRSFPWGYAAQLAVLVSVVILLRDAGARTWLAIMLALFTCNVALAFLASRRGARTVDPERPSPGPVLERLWRRPHFGARRSFWLGTDLGAVGFGVVYALGAVAAAVLLSPPYQSFTLVTVGVLTLVYASSPNRLGFAYLGSLTISAGTTLLMWNADVTATEAYTAPLVLLLAGIGFVQWSRNRSLPTFLTMGPALSVTLGPSLLQSLDDGEEVRLAVVTLVAIGTLVVGLVRRWQAPVTVGGLVLVVVAVTQGGPWVQYVPGWVTLGLAGAVLLAAGVAWERAVLAGRRATTWFHTLR